MSSPDHRFEDADLSRSDGTTVQLDAPASSDTPTTLVNPHDPQALRILFDDYLRMYASRDDRLTTHFSKDFSGFTGGGDFLVKDTAEWIAITRQDFAQIKDPIRIELKDVAIQSLAETITVATGFFVIHLPIKDHILSRETARLVLIFRKESAGWMISHSSISIPYHLVGQGEVYPLRELTDRNQFLEKLVADRTSQLSALNASLQQTNAELAREITERRQMEAALRTSEERYRSILQASPDDITITDQDGRILMISPMAYAIFKAGRNEQFFGRPVTDFIVPEDRARAAAQIALRRRGIMTGPTEYRGLRPDGSTFDIEVNSEFIRDASGSPTGMVVIVRDITERKQAETERKRLEAQNRHLQKSESLGRMAGAIAHHFNNQLHAVMGNLELALAGLPRHAAPVASLTRAMQSALKAADVSRQMLTYLGQIDSESDRLNLTDICRQSLPMLRAAIPTGVSFAINLPSPGPIIHADANQIQQVLINLVANAWEALGAPQGSVHLAVTTAAAVDLPTDNRFPIDWQPRATMYACLEVADTGSGIANEDMEKLFDPFFSTKFAGRGLGLAMGLGIVRTHAGAIAVQSVPGAGSIFRVFLPVAPAPSP